MKGAIKEIIETATKHPSEFKRDNWQHYEHPTAWKIDQDFNWAFLAAIALVITMTITPMIFAPRVTGNSWKKGSDTPTGFQGVTERQYEAGYGDDTAF